ncbi:Fic family protein [Streptomyces gilvifuscus]|uniref:Fic family protein n=1 Tax=Streptomyces gilvifuscus TaxID=1550617 RepID=A0ABT5G026_9ACTN|nr:Fic family protein [Streptomyces gilvifuscus]MDC2958128.1 Fic family protein [Streptomyces gilvifuscus]
MRAVPTGRAVRRVAPVVPPLDARAVPDEDRARAEAALAGLAAAVHRHLGNPDLFHRPRFRTAVHHRYLARVPAHQVTERIAAAAEERAAAGLLAVASVRAEIAERPGRRPCFTPEALRELHALIAGCDPSIPGDGGFRTATGRVTWADGRTFIIAVAPGRELRDHVERWHWWSVRTTAPVLDAAALGMAQLLTVHPFRDANGRTARLLAQCDLVAASLLPGLLLDLEGWTHAHRLEHDEALVAASEGHLTRWGALFARAVADTARHRTATIHRYAALLDAAAARAGDGTPAAAVLTALSSTPALTPSWLRERVPFDPEPVLADLLASGVLVPHPRLPGAAVHPNSSAVLDEPWSAPSRT